MPDSELIELMLAAYCQRQWSCSGNGREHFGAQKQGCGRGRRHQCAQTPSVRAIQISLSLLFYSTVTGCNNSGVVRLALDLRDQEGTLTS